MFVDPFVGIFTSKLFLHRWCLRTCILFIMHSYSHAYILDPEPGLHSLFSTHVPPARLKLPGNTMRPSDVPDCKQKMTQQGSSHIIHYLSVHGTHITHKENTAIWGWTYRRGRVISCIIMAAMAVSCMPRGIISRWVHQIKKKLCVFNLNSKVIFINSISTLLLLWIISNGFLAILLTPFHFAGLE